MRLHHFLLQCNIQYNIAIIIVIHLCTIQGLSDYEHAGITMVPGNDTIEAILQELAAKGESNGVHSSW